jgi:Multiubiquitin
MADNHQDSKDHKKKKITIKIDKETFHVEKEQMTGAELRQLPKPPIGSDRDLFLIKPGPAEDERIADEQPVKLKSGMHFFTAPSTINPGVDASTN